MNAHAKMVAAAVTTLVVAIARPYIPEIATPEIQAALEIIIGAAIVAGVVWVTPNKPKA